MRLSELSERTGVPVATVKYYLREGLLPPGVRVTARLSDYDAGHLSRLHLLRVLREVGQVPISRLRELADAVETRSTVHEVFAAAATALAPEPTRGGPHRPAARHVADRLITEAGWEVRESSADRENLAAVLETFLDLDGRTPHPAVLAPYVDAADTIAETEIASLPSDAGRTRLLEQMVTGQVLFGQLLLVLRRLAEEHHSRRRFGDLAG